MSIGERGASVEGKAREEPCCGPGAGGTGPECGEQGRASRGVQDDFI